MILVTMSGHLVIMTHVQEAFSHLAQRVLCWSEGDTRKIQSNSHIGPNLALTIPDSVMFQHGPLRLKPNGPDLTQCNIQDLYQTMSIGNGDLVSMVECQASNVTLDMSTTDGYEYVITVPANTEIHFEDGTVEMVSGSINHRFSRGNHLIRLVKGPRSAETWVVAPGNAGNLSCGGVILR